MTTVDGAAPTFAAQVLAVFDEDPRQAETSFRHLHTDLVRYLEMRGARDPEDLAQETVARGIRRIKEGVEMFAASPRAYFFGIAKHVLQEEWKCRKEEPLDAETGAQVFSTSREFEAVDAGLRVEKALACLRPRDQEIFVKYHTEDPGSVGRAFGMSNGTLRTRVCRIRQRLQAFLAESESHPDRLAGGGEGGGQNL